MVFRGARRPITTRSSTRNRRGYCSPRIRVSLVVSAAARTRIRTSLRRGFGFRISLTRMTSGGPYAVQTAALMRRLRHRSRQAEPRHLAALKERDCADPTTRQGDHDELDAVSHATQGAVEIDAECGLAVCTSREEPVAPAIAERNCRKPALDLLLAAVLTRSRWHPHPRVLSQKGHQRAGIAFLPGTNQSVDGLLFGS